jgi:hypothetical protein
MHVCLFQSKVLHPTGPLDTSPIAPLDATVCHNRPDHAATEGRKHDPCHPTSHVAIQYLAQVLPELGLRCLIDGEVGTSAGGGGGGGRRSNGRAATDRL